MLLREKFGILGTSLGLINADVNIVANEFAKWQSKVGLEYGFSISTEDVSSDIESSLEMLFPLTLPVRQRYLFSPTVTGWTAFFDNGTLGTDAAGVMPILSKALSVSSIRVTCVPHTMPLKILAISQGNFGANILEVYGESGDVQRSVYCANDGGKWKFGQSGEPYSFENREKYLGKRISERFNEEELRRYLMSLAVDGLDDTAYLAGQRTGVLVRKHGNFPLGAKVSFAELARL